MTLTQPPHRGVESQSTFKANMISFHNSLISSNIGADVSTINGNISNINNITSGLSYNYNYWVSSTAYSANSIVISTVDNSPYISKNAVTSTVDPANDTTNWNNIAVYEQAIKTGDIIQSIESSKTGYLECNGNSLDSAAYPALYDKLDTYKLNGTYTTGPNIALNSSASTYFSPDGKYVFLKNSHTNDQGIYKINEDLSITKLLAVSTSNAYNSCEWSGNRLAVSTGSSIVIYSVENNIATIVQTINSSCSSLSFSSSGKYLMSIYNATLTRYENFSGIYIQTGYTSISYTKNIIACMGDDIVAVLGSNSYSIWWYSISSMNLTNITYKSGSYSPHYLLKVPTGKHIIYGEYPYMNIVKDDFTVKSFQVDEYWSQTEKPSCFDIYNNYYFNYNGTVKVYNYDANTSSYTSASNSVYITDSSVTISSNGKYIAKTGVNPIVIIKNSQKCLPTNSLNSKTIKYFIKT